jgi:hypothetical protein
MGAGLRAVAMLLGIGALAGCWSSGAVDDSARTVPAGDPAYALAALHDQPVGDYFVLPQTLAEALPKHRVTETRSGAVASFSDGLAVGPVTGAARGAGVIWRGEDDFTVVGFDDERASTRTVVVTMTTEHGSGLSLPSGGQLSFRVLVPQQADPERFASSLAGLGRIAVVLDRDPSPTDRRTPWRPIIDDRLIAVVGQDGTLTLPTMRHAAAFAGDIHTESDLLAAARGPRTTTTYTAP